MDSRRVMITCGLLAALALPATQASAWGTVRHQVPLWDPSYAPEGVQPGRFQANGQACVKQCPDDLTPCDPPVYKHADGRCNQFNR